MKGSNARPRRRTYYRWWCKSEATERPSCSSHRSWFIQSFRNQYIPIHSEHEQQDMKYGENPGHTCFSVFCRDKRSGTINTSCIHTILDTMADTAACIQVHHICSCADKGFYQPPPSPLKQAGPTNVKLTSPAVASVVVFSPFSPDNHSDFFSRDRVSWNTCERYFSIQGIWENYLDTCTCRIDCAIDEWRRSIIGRTATLPFVHRGLNYDSHTLCDTLATPTFTFISISLICPEHMVMTRTTPVLGLAWGILQRCLE